MTRHDTIQKELLSYVGCWDTGRWLLNSERFQKWLYYPQHIVWLRGSGLSKTLNWLSDR